MHLLRLQLDAVVCHKVAGYQLIQQPVNHVIEFRYMDAEIFRQSAVRLLRSSWMLSSAAKSVQLPA